MRFSRGHTAPEIKNTGADMMTTAGAVHPFPVSVAAAMAKAVTAAVKQKATKNTANGFCMAPYSPNEKSKPCMYKNHPSATDQNARNTATAP